MPFGKKLITGFDHKNNRNSSVTLKFIHVCTCAKCVSRFSCSFTKIRENSTESRLSRSNCFVSSDESPTRRASNRHWLWVHTSAIKCSKLQWFRQQSHSASAWQGNCFSSCMWSVKADRAFNWFLQFALALSMIMNRSRVDHSSAIFPGLTKSACLNVRSTQWVHLTFATDCLQIETAKIVRHRLREH